MIALLYVEHLIPVQFIQGMLENKGQQKFNERQDKSDTIAVDESHADLVC